MVRGKKSTEDNEGMNLFRESFLDEIQRRKDEIHDPDLIVNLEMLRSETHVVCDQL